MMCAANRNRGGVGVAAFVRIDLRNRTQIRLPKHPQPVPPIFQPEVGARAVAFVVQHPRRRTMVTWRTSAIAVGNAFAPRLFDWFVARTAVSGQQTDEQLPVYGDNLDKPVHDDIGAHGSFDHRAKSASPETWPCMKA